MNIKFKRIFSFLLVLFLTIVLVGCSTKKDNKALDTLNEYADKVFLPETEGINQSFKLPKYAFGVKQYEITWTSSDTAVIDVIECFKEADKDMYWLAFVTLAKQKKTVILTAEVKDVNEKNLKVTRTFTIEVVADNYVEYASIELAKKAEGKTKDESTVKFEGVVTAITNSGYVVSDDSASIYMYKSAHEREVGEKVVVRGIWTSYNNMPQIKDAASDLLGYEKPFDLGKYAENKSLDEITAIVPQKLDDVNCTKIFKTKFKAVAQPAGSYNAYKLVDPFDNGKFVEVSKYNDASTISEVGTLANDKFYEGYVIIYCSRSVGSENVWDVLYIPNSAKEVTIELTPEQKIDGIIKGFKDKFNLKLIADNMELPLLDEDSNAVIEWKSNNEKVITSTGEYLAPASKTTVELTVTVTIGELVVSDTITVYAKALEAHKNYISLARKAYNENEADVEARVEGVVTAVIGNSFYIQDGDSALMVYNLANHGFNVGDNVYVIATITCYNGLYETKSKSVTEFGYVDTKYYANRLELEEFKPEVLSGCDNLLFSMYGVEFVSGTFTVDDKNTLIFKDRKGNNFTVFTDKYMDNAEEQKLADIVNSLKAGDKIDIVDAVVGWHSNPQVTPTINSLRLPNPIKQARDSYVNEDVPNTTVKGVVTTVFGDSYFVQNDYYAIEIYNHKNHGFKAGDVVSVTGTLTVFNGLYEIKSVTASSKITDNITANVVEVFNLDKDAQMGMDCVVFDMNNLVYVSGEMKKTDDTKYVSGYKSSTIKFETLSGLVVEARTDAYIQKEDADALNELLLTLKPGYIVSLVGVNMGWYNAPQVTLVNANQVKVNTIVAARNQYVDKDVENVVAEGVVTAVVDNTYFIQDGDYAIQIYNQKNHGLVVGDVVSVTGTLTVYNNIYEFKNATSTKIEKNYVANPLRIEHEFFDADTLKNKDNVIGTIYDVKFDSVADGAFDSSKSTIVNFKTKDDTIVAYKIDKYMPVEEQNLIKGIVEGLKAGDVVTIKGAAIAFYKGNPQFYATAASNIIAPQEAAK